MDRGGIARGIRQARSDRLDTGTAVARNNDVNDRYIRPDPTNQHRDPVELFSAERKEKFVYFIITLIFDMGTILRSKRIGIWKYRPSRIDITN